MSRFLIRPSVRCDNLASRLLAMAAKQLPEDFEQFYGYRPYLNALSTLAPLESFVGVRDIEVAKCSDSFFEAYF